MVKHKTVIGDKELVYSRSFVLKDDQIARITVEVEEGAIVDFELQIKTATEKPNYSWHISDGLVKILIEHKLKEMGTAVTQPKTVGTVSEKAVGFSLTQTRTTLHNNIVLFQVYLGGKYE